MSIRVYHLAHLDPARRKSRTLELGFFPCAFFLFSFSRGAVFWADIPRAQFHRRYRHWAVCARWFPCSRCMTAMGRACKLRWRCLACSISILDTCMHASVRLEWMIGCSEFFGAFLFLRRLSLETRRVESCSSVARSLCFSYCFHTAFIPLSYPPPPSHHTHFHPRTHCPRWPSAVLLPPATPFTNFPCLSVSAPSHYSQIASPTPSASPPPRSNNVPQTCAVRLIGSERSSPTTR